MSLLDQLLAILTASQQPFGGDADDSKARVRRGGTALRVREVVADRSARVWIECGGRSYLQNEHREPGGRRAEDKPSQPHARRQRSLDVRRRSVRLNLIVSPSTV